MKYRGIFEYEYPTEHKPPVSIDVYLHGDCVKGKIIEWEYMPLEQEPCEDAISRQAIIEEMEKRYVEGDCITKGFVKNMPSVTPQEPKMEWIPVSERLPKLDVDVLVTDIHRNRFVHTLKYDSKDAIFYWEDDAGFFVVFNDVVAWMPLPESYKAESEK